mmetsp:Transcript_40343/g.128204  ORF Transcript_40343/g.128204 Transcript_40343/m.128204 type:complete len:252 (-) Transcript_40343:2-757(-)
MDEPEALPNGFRLRNDFALGHLLLLLVVFLPPFAYSLFLGFRPDVAYFVGRGALTALVVVPAALFIPALYANGRRKVLSGMVMTSVWVPALIFALIGGVHSFYAREAIAALESRDCYSFPEKRELQRGYEVAVELYLACTERPGLQLATVADCPRYPVLSDGWKRQFGYLQALEERFPCAGICMRGRRIWQGSGEIAPACGAFASQWLWSAEVQASLILGYGIFLMLASIPVKLLVVDPLVEQINAPLALP